jgi:hypothetical protein
MSCATLGNAEQFFDDLERTAEDLSVLLTSGKGGYKLLTDRLPQILAESAADAIHLASRMLELVPLLGLGGKAQAEKKSKSARVRVTLQKLLLKSCHKQGMQVSLEQKAAAKGVLESTLASIGTAEASAQPLHAGVLGQFVLSFQLDDSVGVTRSWIVGKADELYQTALRLDSTEILVATVHFVIDLELGSEFECVQLIAPLMKKKMVDEAIRLAANNQSLQRALLAEMEKKQNKENVKAAAKLISRWKLPAEDFNWIWLAKRKASLAWMIATENGELLFDEIAEDEDEQKMVVELAMGKHGADHQFTHEIVHHFGLHDQFPQVESAWSFLITLICHYSHFSLLSFLSALTVSLLTTNVSALTFSLPPAICPRRRQVKRQCLDKPSEEKQSAGDGANYIRMATFRLQCDQAIIFVDTVAQVTAVREAVFGGDAAVEGSTFGAVVGLDCEWRPITNYMPQTAAAGGAQTSSRLKSQPCALLQLGHKSTVWLFDMAAVVKDGNRHDNGSNSGGSAVSGELFSAARAFFEELLCSTVVLKLGYGLHADLAGVRACFPEWHHVAHANHHLEFRYTLDLRSLQQPRFAPVQDREEDAGPPSTTIFAPPPKRGQGSLSDLALSWLGGSLDKSCRMSNWEKRPLSARQMECEFGFSWLRSTPSRWIASVIHTAFQYFCTDAALDAYCLLEIFKAMQCHLNDHTISSYISNSNAGPKLQSRA